jgi:PKD repeat protein
MKLNYWTQKSNVGRIPIVFILFLILSLFVCANTVNACVFTIGTFDSPNSNPKTTFFQGETVYGKGTCDAIGYYMLRIRDPNNNEFNSPVIYGEIIKHEWDLDKDTTLGEWNIQIGEFLGDSWIWSTKPGRIAYFDVIKRVEYNLLIDVFGIGTITKTPNQNNYITGTVVELIANPGAGWSFDRWEGDVDNNLENPTTINMNGNKTVVVHFKKESSNNEYYTGGGSNEFPVSGFSESTEIENLLPIADISFGENFQGFISVDIIFNGSQSYDPDGYITSWIWDFGDGTNGSGISVSHSYKDLGEYPVILTVTDDKGATNMSECLVLITQQNIIQSNPVNGPIDTQTTQPTGIPVVNEKTKPDSGNMSFLIFVIITLLVIILLFRYIKIKKIYKEN